MTPISNLGGITNLREALVLVQQSKWAYQDPFNDTLIAEITFENIKLLP